MLRAVMAISDDNFVATGPKDDMKWTGSLDKQLFRDLTLTRQPICGVGSTTFDIMPKNLAGRRLIKLSTHSGDAMTLQEFSEAFPDAWLIGGQTVILEALKAGLLENVYLFRNSARIGAGVKNLLDDYLSFSLHWYVEERKFYGTHGGHVIIAKWRNIEA